MKWGYIFMTSFIMKLSFTLWGFFMFVDRSFNCTLNFFCSIIHSFIPMLCKCSVVWLLFSRIGNNVPVMCWDQENMMIINFLGFVFMHECFERLYFVYQCLDFQFFHLEFTIFMCFIAQYNWPCSVMSHFCYDT